MTAREGSKVGLNRIYATFPETTDDRSLSALCNQLSDNQKAAWPDCREGYATLDSVRKREIECDGYSVVVQNNPGRMKSTTALVNAHEIRERACFLCSDKLPPEQKAVFYHDRYLILCNPMPVLAPHFTVASIIHEPQRIAGNIAYLLQLTVDLGEGWTVLYNGPRCGASAPDHLHFQIVPSGLLPMERVVNQGEAYLLKCTDSVAANMIRGMGRPAVCFEGRHPEGIGKAFSLFMRGLKDFLKSDDEPMINIVGFQSDGIIRLIVFPRRKHRPDLFFAEKEKRVLVSPAVIEMAGIIVTPVEKDYYGLRASDIDGIYKEVSLEQETVEEVLKTLP